ncbi:NAD/NADP octopine/nopaline dehydrogenase family protein [Jeotgalibaca sp. MA1X17-3]|uniref:NAD/NADP-dependent octopine/nopaline dehydrogenase family protein n=1 Tax=Jeotgalibaca sp. MA1X17-3 TaxID=2908211 RepID=UPI001F36DE3F|nr:NAD/NADP-dependent octopine/nopaline dehydrogenase family protein [Jeotgalibaca sp. MA1X17-3]UJF15329.1 NAD/NADP octopine/nopaline dehydrogenase family protein [Jeotgalibaca sp. MA1X17-3]
MNITIIGAGNSGLAMAAHLTLSGNTVTLWNRTRKNIEGLLENPIIHCRGAVEGDATIHLVTSNLAKALKNPDIVFVTTPAFSHKQLATQIALVLKKTTTIILSPGRTFGALEFKHEFKRVNAGVHPLIAETQTILYTCRKITCNEVEMYALKNDVLLSTVTGEENQLVINQLPACLRDKFIPAESMIETSIGNVGMVLHCAPLLLNTGWVESEAHSFYYYREGISPTIAHFIEKMDAERQLVAMVLGNPVESAKDWMKRTYKLTGENLYEVIQNNDAYETILGPKSLLHRYITEDIPTGLVPLEAVGKELGLEMTHVSLIIDLASALLEIDFRKEGRNLHNLIDKQLLNPRAMLQFTMNPLKEDA